MVSVISFLGFVLGGLLGLWLMPELLAGQTPSGTRSLVALGGVVLLAVAVQALAGFLGALLRDRITWQPARRVDSVGGGVVGIIAVLTAVWLLGGVLVRGDLSAAAVAGGPRLQGARGGRPRDAGHARRGLLRVRRACSTRPASPRCSAT